MSTQGGDVSFKFGADTSGLTAAVREVAAQQEAAASTAVKAAAAAQQALEAQRTATVKVSDAEKEFIAKMLGAEAAAKSKAAALGITVSQLRSLEKATAAATAAQSQSAASAGVQAAAVGAAATKFDKLGMAMGPIAGVVSKIDPAAGAALSSVAGLTSGFQGLAAAGIAVETAVPVLGAVAAVVATAAYAWSVYNEQAERTVARTKQAADAAKTEAEYMRDLDAAQYHLKQTTGTLTEAEEKLHIRQEASRKLAEDSVGKTDEQVSALRGLSSKIAYAKEQEVEYAYASKASSEALNERAKETAAASAAHAKMAQQFAADQKTMQAAMAEDARLNGQAASALDSLAKMQADASKATLSGVEAENAALAEAEARALAVYQAGVEAASGQTDTLMELAREYEAARVALAKASAKKVAGIREEEADKAIEEKKREAAKTRAIEAQTNDSILSLAGSTHDALILYAESQGKKNKEAARVAFHAAQAVAAGQAVISAALAVSNALATVPYPAAPFVAAAAAAVGAVQVATILSEKPSFHSGGMLYPDEGNATLLRGEPVLNRQAAARIGLDNPAAVADVNHGGAGAPSIGGVTVLRIGRLEAREIVRSDVVAGGLIVQTARAAAASAGNPAGRTGRRPIA